ncbi:archaemetzincin-2 isoform X5 [Brienomyrus brachyistius]|uniref:archaemetzincin-2 isoform X5 n=1 Tax=Brienomyrus brachyistius TaxID=42636 RepID=UPI0020B1C868|nr:archaemetzincin-2 isoform X5 [Brienomyrus brachyistius]
MQVIQHPAEKLRNALVSSRRDLMECFQKYSHDERRLMEDGLHPDSPLFGPITIHSDSDWISSHPETPQDFQSFYSDPYRSTPIKSRNTIYIQTIGDLLNFLKKKKPKDAFCIVGITMIDLYPKDSWNFVFGQASLTGGMGVFSFARYDDNFYSIGYKGRLQKGKRLRQGDYTVFAGYYTPPITSTLLLRSCKTLTHEIGHIFSITHCQWLQCVMQGSNHLEESDRRPPELCPICLRKLQSVLGFKIADRYKALLQWIEQDLASGEQHTAPSPSGNMARPMQAFEDHRLWLQRCLSVLQDEIF